MELFGLIKPLLVSQLLIGTGTKRASVQQILSATMTLYQLKGYLMRLQTKRFDLRHDSVRMRLVLRTICLNARRRLALTLQRNCYY